MTRHPGEARRIWAAPILIAAVTLIGLIGALVSEGFWDWLAALLLFAMLAYATALGLLPSQRNRG